ncbi:MAG: redoxin domain-containing protein [Bacteroides sp.]
MRIVKLFILIIMTAGTLAGNAQNAEQGIRVGDKAPDFTLKDQNGKEVNLYQLLKKGPVVLNWYRGGWCPYCNLELKGLADKAMEITQLGATLIALSPELPDRSLTTIEKNALPFTVLSDTDNNVARQYDLVFKLDTETANRYESKFGLSQYNGNDNAELPIPATYIIDQKGIIRYAFVNPDYKKRANPEDVVMQLTQLVRSANNNKLVLVWSSDDPMVAERVALMFPHAAQKSKWFSEVTLVVWGPSAKLIANDAVLQKKIGQMQTDGVKVEACIACATAYGVVDKLKALNYDVLPMGEPLANYLKRGYQVITF